MSRARANLIHLLVFFFFFFLFFHRIDEWVFEKFSPKRGFSFFKLKCNCFNTVQMTHSSFSDLKSVFCTCLFRVKYFEIIHRYSFKFLIQVWSFVIIFTIQWKRLFHCFYTFYRFKFYSYTFYLSPYVEIISHRLYTYIISIYFINKKISIQLIIYNSINFI